MLYTVKVGNHTSQHPDLTRRFHTQRRALIHATKLVKIAGHSANDVRVLTVKDGDKVFTRVPFGDNPS